MVKEKVSLKGLTTEEVKTLQQKYGKNELETQKKENFFKKYYIL